ncbi:MAG: hypothetical protein Q8O40_05795 [Chloroflexota bacterium]|nr:hypothetical protein [Chloroflexota bacterium]
MDFHQHATVLHLFEGKVATTRMVSAMDVAHALARELSIASDLLPEGALWWVNTADGPVTAIWQPPRVWKVALQVEAMGKPQRYRLPMPGLIFLCRPGLPPWVFAAKTRPSSEQEPVYKAPLFNVFNDGRVCAGTHKFPMQVAEIPDSFFRSYFSPTGDYNDRSKKFPKDLRKLWKGLSGVKEYPLDDLVPHGTLKDIKNMQLRSRR